eukprot:82377_1
MSVDNTRSDSYGTWLVIISMSTRSILCKVRIDDHDHQLVLSEIRDMIHNKLKDNRHNTEYCHGFTFGIGWPLKIVTKEEEHTILAQSVLPFVSVLSTQSAQHISNTINKPISTAIAPQSILNTNFMPRSRPTVGTALLHLQPQTQPNNIHADVGNDAVKTEKPHPGLRANSARSNANTAQQGNTRGKIKFEPGTDEFESAIHWLCDAAKNGKYPSVRYLMGECHIGFSKANIVIKHYANKYMNMTASDFKKQFMVIKWTKNKRTDESSGTRSVSKANARGSRKKYGYKHANSPLHPIVEHKSNLTDISSASGTKGGNQSLQSGYYSSAKHVLAHADSSNNYTYSQNHRSVSSSSSHIRFTEECGSSE